VLEIRPDAPTRVAAERVTRDFNRRPVPRPVAVTAAVVVAQPTVRVVQKPAKTSSVAAKKPAKPAAKSAPKLEVVSVPASGRAAVVVAFARSALGRPYVYGASGPSSYDCSGLVVAAYRRIGVGLPHKASAFYGVGRAVSRAQLQPGDIIVMARGSHAGIYVGGGLMIHAPHPGARVEVAPIWSFSAARRVI
jgi:peptidoglycan DL-endopeptidase CwlO